jgi:hypothetical protein
MPKSIEPKIYTVNFRGTLHMIEGWMKWQCHSVDEAIEMTRTTVKHNITITSVVERC